MCIRDRYRGVHFEFYFSQEVNRDVGFFTTMDGTVLDHTTDFYTLRLFAGAHLQEHARRYRLRGKQAPPISWYA